MVGVVMHVLVLMVELSSFVSPYFQIFNKEASISFHTLSK